MATTDQLRRVYREQFCRFFEHDFENWFEKVLRQMYPRGSFNQVRIEQGDGGIDAFDIDSATVYQLYAPAGWVERNDKNAAAKIKEDFAKANSHLGGRLKEWCFVYNHPTGRAGKRMIAAINELRHVHESVSFRLLGINDLWDRLECGLTKEALTALFRDTDDERLHSSLAKLPTGGEYVIGRERDKQLLDQAWSDPQVKVVSVWGAGGVGKTSLVRKWLENSTSLPKGTRMLGWSFYSTGADDRHQASSDEFFNFALRRFFGVRDQPTDPFERGQLLANRIRDDHMLLILDGLERLQFRDGDREGRIQDRAIASLVKELAHGNTGLCVCTSRFKLKDLEGQSTALSIELRNLTPQGGCEYLRKLGVEGEEPELQRASAEVGNHPLALTLLGRYTVIALGRCIQKRDTIPTLYNEPEHGPHAWRVIRWYEGHYRDAPGLLAILRILGLFNEPADPLSIDALRLSPSIPGLTSDLEHLTSHGWRFAVEQLRQAGLVSPTKDEGDETLDCHLLIRDYFAQELQNKAPAAFREGHLRLHAHLLGRSLLSPRTQEEVSALSGFVYHGCRAGKAQEACQEYRKRLLSQSRKSVVRRLGAFGTVLSALTNFFAKPWNQPVFGLSDENQAWVLSRAGSALRAVGRPSDATEPLLESISLEACAQPWHIRARSLNNLVQLYLTLGNIHEAIETARLYIGEADRQCIREPHDRKLKYYRLESRTALASALHQSGDFACAYRMFRAAEKMQDKCLPEYRGFLYCELLIDYGRPDKAFERATRFLKKETNLEPLHAALYWLIVGRTSPAGSRAAADALAKCMRLLGEANYVDEFPRGLLAQATNYRTTGNFGEAVELLEKVRSSCSRCEMQLYLADYHLENTRLLLDRCNRTDARSSLQEARQLISKTGYWRRGEELAVLESQLAD